MISFYLTWIFLLSLVKYIFMEISPFDLTFNYNNKQIINQNFTITTQLQQNLPINCENNRSRLCLVELSLQIQSDIKSIDYWCQSPSSSNRLNTCTLSIIDFNQQPSITIIINSPKTGKVFLLAKANFTYLPEYYSEKQVELNFVRI